jgi:purine catabolism regulator
VEPELPDELGDTLIAEVGKGCVVGLVPLAGERSAEADAAALAEQLSAAGFEAAVSAARKEPSLLREAVREAMLIAELACAPEAALAGQEETYRLLVGVLLRDPDELELLRSRTITPLIGYDAEHDTDLLMTLGTFLAHHGSTTETAEAMGLHRHTVGYRLSRVQEVSGLSPYETDGRERLSLGLKAAQILAAQERL